MFGDMKHGEQRQVKVLGKQFGVTYNSQQAFGDNGKPVRGATTGYYHIDYPNGKTTSHYHGPYANTEAAAKKGAHRTSKYYAAGQALDAITTHARTSDVFNDRR